VLSLPQGGGALKGIGETFAPDLHTGTGNFTVPIALPPGRNGFQPSISLVYSTGNGNGTFGLGWGLSIPGVGRKTDKGIPRYRDYDAREKADVFVLSGAEDLVPVDSDPQANPATYCPRTEGLFAKILHHHDAQDDYWEVQSKDGLTSIYGTPRPDDATDSWRDPATIERPGDSARRSIFTWKLTETRDLFGNLIRYEYDSDEGAEGPHVWRQPLLRRIRYVDYGDPDQDNFLISVTFDYEERPDPFSNYRAGFEIRTTMRCVSLTIRTHANQERVVRKYRFQYGEAPYNGVSFLERIDVIGYDDDGNPYDGQVHNGEERPRQLPPLTFAYTTFEPAVRRFDPVTGVALPVQSLAGGELELADLTGDGLPDFLELNGATRYWRNLGGGRFDLPRTMSRAPGLRLADPGVQLLDADGDGRLDLMATVNSLVGYFPLGFNGEFDRGSFRKFAQAPSFNLEDPEVRLVDLNGDGVTDAIRAGTSLECYFNDAEAGWLETSRVARQHDLSAFPDINFSDPRVKWADMTGDNLQDIVLVYDGNIEYWPNLGHGNWGQRVHMRNSPRFYDSGYTLGYDPRRVLLGDVDGDGAADIVYVGNNKVTVWINCSGNEWSDPIEIAGTPRVTDTGSVQLVDLLGSGIAGVLWSAESNGRNHHLHFLDLTGGVKPYLLNRMDNHMGAVTKVTYRSSTHDYLRDRLDRRWRWQAPLPFPVQVVGRVEVTDAISRGRLVTEYRYHHGYWDGVEREFRGFGMVEQLDTETFTDYEPLDNVLPVEEERFSPPTLTRTWFHQGPVGEGREDWQECDRTGEYWSGDPALLAHTAGVNAYLNGLDGGRVVYTRRMKRDALRALRGSVLRTELYALDGPPGVAGRPYTVSEVAYGLREESPPADPSTGRLRIFFPHAIARRETRWERGEDPLTQFTFIGDYDAWGQPRRQTQVAMPRRSVKRRPVTGALVGAVNPDETRVLATHSHTEYAAPPAGVHLRDRTAQVRNYELGQPPVVNESDPADLIAILADQYALAQVVDARFRTGNGVTLFAHVLNHYDGGGLAEFGQTGQYGALTRSEALVFTAGLLNRAYGSRRPVYLGGSQALPAGAPANFGAGLGYRRETAAPYAGGYYADAQHQTFDFQQDPNTHRGLIAATHDPLGHTTTIEYDAFELLPERVVDAIGLETRAVYNLRLFQPEVITDANGHETHEQYTPIGLVAAQYLRGRGGEGGTAVRPETAYEYDFLAYDRSRDDISPQPIFVHTTRRVNHAADGIDDETIESHQYSDGFGRLIQTRAQAEELVFGATGDDVGLFVNGEARPGQAGGPAAGGCVADRVVVSGWQLYDNKERIIRKYEPFFSAGWAYEPETTAGVHADLFYDPLGRLVRTLNPDGSEQRIIFGVPGAVVAPDPATVAGNEIAYEPTPWESFTYDANDLAALTAAPGGAPLAGRAPADHHFTPFSSRVDALGRTLGAVERNGPNPAADWYVTRSTYDIRGNLLTITDARGNVAFRHAYDLLNRPLLVDSIDAGRATTVSDATGIPVEGRDAKGAVVLRAYDLLNRPKEVWARDGGAGGVTLRERLTYGDEGDRALARGRNQLGRLAIHYDEAGVLRFDRYDFKGNVLEKSRRTIADGNLANGWRADWNAANAELALDPVVYRTTFRYDALNRTVEVDLPADSAGNRARLTPGYNRAGALERVALDGQAYVTQIAYNARGQRVLIAYGNGMMTRYAYDPQTFRLSRLRSERFNTPAADTWRGQGAARQDLTYTYDLASNITGVEERTPNCGIAGSQDGRNRLRRAFTYDPLYRLLSATGRACADTGRPRPFDDAARCGAFPPPYRPGAPVPNQNNAPDLTEFYTERYDYDPAGNISAMRYTAARNWTRQCSVEAGSNRLVSLRTGPASADVTTFQYDAAGNLRQQNADRTHDWDHANRLRRFRRSAGAGNSVDARYLYGADGQRVKKWTRRGGNAATDESIVYIDAVFEHHRWRQKGAPRQNHTIHVVEDQSRIALARSGPAHPEDAGPPVQYHLGDHLGSSNLVAGGGDAQGSAFISREEYYPYGETSFGSFGKKRYRFTGKERDEESGLYYNEARYYVPWLARWLSCDPKRSHDGHNKYEYTQSNPIASIDPDGLATQVVTAGPVLQASEVVESLALGGEAVTEGELAAEVASTGASGLAGATAVLAGFIVGMYLLAKNSISTQNSAANRARREAFGMALRQAGIITENELRLLRRNGVLYVGGAKTAAYRAAFSNAVTARGFRFEVHTINTATDPYTGELLSDLRDSGALDFQFDVTSRSGTRRIPDIIRHGLWVGDKKAGQILYSDQTKAFVDAAAATMLRTLVFFVPGSEDMPKDVLDALVPEKLRRYAEDLTDKYGNPTPVKIIVHPVPGFEELPPRYDPEKAGRVPLDWGKD
jgi:RHS repeat-associated protein